MAMPSRRIRAQGGQWACVFVDLSFVGYLPEDRNLGSLDLYGDYTCHKAGLPSLDIPQVS